MLDQNDDKTAALPKEMQKIKWELLSCYKFETERLESLAGLIRDADSRGILTDELLEMVDVMYWLELLDWQKKWLRMLLDFGGGPKAKTLKPLIEMYGPDPKRVKADLPPLNEATPGARILGGCNQGRAGNAKRKGGAGRGHYPEAPRGRSRAG
jgi:hypothetical protein